MQSIIISFTILLILSIHSLVRIIYQKFLIYNTDSMEQNDTVMIIQMLEKDIEIGMT